MQIKGNLGKLKPVFRKALKGEIKKSNVIGLKYQKNPKSSKDSLDDDLNGSPRVFEKIHHDTKASSISDHDPRSTNKLIYPQDQ